jgi:hypothetical protein
MVILRLNPQLIGAGKCYHLLLIGPANQCGKPISASDTNAPRRDEHLTGRQ